MSLLKKKEKSEPAKKEEVPAGPVLPEDAGWRAWEQRGFDFIAKGDVANAVACWIGAIDRFEGKDKWFDQFRTKSIDSTVTAVAAMAKSGKTCPVHLLADIDMETRAKMPEYSDKLFTDMFCEGIEKKIDGASSPAEAVMIGVAVTYSTTGYLRRTDDIREGVDRCRAIAEFDRKAAEMARSFKFMKFRGDLHPKDAAAYCDSYADMLDLFADGIEKEASAEGFDKIVEYRKTHPVDLLKPLSDAVDHSNRRVVKFGKKKVEDARGMCVSAFLSEYKDIGGEDVPVPAD